MLDLRYFPLTFIKKKGDPSEAYVHAYYKWRKAASAFAHENGMIHIVVKDIDEWGIPKPTIRKMIGDYASRDTEDVGFAWRYIVVTKPVMRGAVTAILWIKGDTQRVSFVASYADAIRTANQLFQDSGCQPPSIDPAGFVPSWELKS
ncbi:hypothetical protein [Enhygromyxa salina]|uniref:hypothetical protein n=1 Tax=Enhygromyxa salina TaxID=215803 RepID=UPI0011B28DDC|nr:hypothetical protein [Enhygromyxa salina]